MEEKERGKGGIESRVDRRDFQWGEELGHASAPFDWTKGYDVEEELGFTLAHKDQGSTSSCGGFAWGYLGQVLDFFNDGEYEVKSPKFIYAQTHAPGGGSAGRTNCDLIIRAGWGNEADTPTFPPGGITEAFVTNAGDITPLAKYHALKDRAMAYANVSLDLELLAQAVRDNRGAILGVTGKNNGTWNSEFPKPPDNLQGSWRHWLYCGKVKKIGGKRHYGILNSWGDVGDNGWQWLSEDYIKKNILFKPLIWEIWTMVAKKDEPPAVTPVPPTPLLTKTLRLTMTDNEVKILQNILKKNGFFPSNVDTTFYFGSITLNSVKTFQQKYGLVVDGIVGLKSRTVLNKLP